MRAHHRGYQSLLFGEGRTRFESKSGTAETTPLEVGPTEEFPFRSRVVSRLKPDGVVRVWFASASHGEDTALPVPDVFPNRMGPFLAEKTGRCIEVLNASRAGLVIADNGKELDSLGPAWGPDYAILYGLSMDLGVLSRQFLTGGTASTESDSEQEPGKPVAGFSRRLERLWEETTLYAQLKSNLTTLITRERLLADSIPAAAGDLLRADLNEFVDAALAVGATPVLTTFATSHGWNSSVPLPLTAEQFMVRYNPYLKPSGWVKAIHSLNGVIRDVATARGVMLIDLEGSLTNRPWLFRDPVHFSPQGHEETAEQLAQGLANAISEKNGGGAK